MVKRNRKKRRSAFFLRCAFFLLPNGNRTGGLLPNTLPHTATHCSTLQPHCNTLQHTAAHCNHTATTLLPNGRTGAKRMHIAGRAFDSRLGGDGYRGAVTAGDGSNQKRGGMVAGYVNLRGKGKRQQRKVGHEEE